MKLSKETLDVLKNFSTINPSIQFHPGNKLRTMSPNKTIIAEAVVPDEFESTFAIYDLSRFMGVVSLFDDPTYTVGERSLSIKSNGRKVSYTFADPETITVPPPENLDVGTPFVEFVMESKKYNEAMKALGVMSLPEFVMVGDGENIYLRATNTNDPSSDKYDIVVGETEKTFNAVFRTENMKIRSMDYQVKVSDRGMAYFENETMKYWVSIEEHSEFGG